MASERRDIARRREESRKRRKNQKVSVLSTPKPPVGFKFYWANRFRDGGKDDVQNFLLKQREGFEFVTPDELKKCDPTFELVADETAGNRCIVGDLVLMKVSLEDAEDLEWGEEDMAREMLLAQKKELLNASTEKMPTFDESKQSVSSRPTFG